MQGQPRLPATHSHPPTLILLIYRLSLHNIWQAQPRWRLGRLTAQLRRPRGLRRLPLRLRRRRLSLCLAVLQHAGGGAPGAPQLASGWVDVPRLRNVLRIQQAVILHLQQQAALDGDGDGGGLGWRMGGHRAQALHAAQCTASGHQKSACSSWGPTCAAASGSTPSASSSARSPASSAGSCCAAAMRSEGRICRGMGPGKWVGAC